MVCEPYRSSESDAMDEIDEQNTIENNHNNIYGGQRITRSTAAELNIQVTAMEMIRTRKKKKNTKKTINIENTPKPKPKRKRRPRKKTDASKYSKERALTVHTLSTQEIETAAANLNKSLEDGLTWCSSNNQSWIDIKTQIQSTVLGKPTITKDIMWNVGGVLALFCTNWSDTYRQFVQKVLAWVVCSKAMDPALLSNWRAIGSMYVDYCVFQNNGLQKLYGKAELPPDFQETATELADDQKTNRWSEDDFNFTNPDEAFCDHLFDNEAVNPLWSSITSDILENQYDGSKGKFLRQYLRRCLQIDTQNLKDVTMHQEDIKTTAIDLLYQAQPGESILHGTGLKVSYFEYCDPAKIRCRKQATPYVKGTCYYYLTGLCFKYRYISNFRISNLMLYI